MAQGLLLCCLAALLPSIMLYFPNMAEISFISMLPYFGIMLGLGILAWLGMYLITRRKGLSAIAAAVWLLVLLNVGRFVPALQSVFPLIGLKVIAPVTLVFLVAVTFALSRLREEFLCDSTKVAVLALAAFFLSSAVPAVISLTGTEKSAAVESVSVDSMAEAGTDRPNIYWIVADEFAGFEELEKYYHYDNLPFRSALEEMGFTVSGNSYNWTTDTVRIFRDILNLRYVADSEGDRNEFVSDPDAPLWTLLRNQGYEICEVESTNKFRLLNLLADPVLESIPETETGDSVASLLIRYSLLYRYEDDIISRILPKQSKETARDSILNVFAWAENAENLKFDKPTCTLIYVKCPHSPYFFDRNGGAVPEEHRTDDKDKRYYLDQLMFTSSHLLKMCRAILTSDPDSIIILQSDHGMRRVANVTSRDQSNILNAVYFRGEPVGEIEGKNGLNTWLFVLEKQFHFDFPYVKEIRLKNAYKMQYYDPDDEDPNDGLIAKPD